MFFRIYLNLNRG